MGIIQTMWQDMSPRRKFAAKVLGVCFALFVFGPVPFVGFGWATFWLGLSGLVAFGLVIVVAVSVLIDKEL
jgi:hypothetical protein